jgi:hypothetical protein
MVTLEHLIEYFAAIFRTILALFGVEINEETADNLESMFNGLLDYQPEA